MEVLEEEGVVIVPVDGPDTLVHSHPVIEVPEGADDFVPSSVVELVGNVSC